MLPRLLIGVAAALALPACGGARDEAPAPEGAARARAAITGGEPSPSGAEDGVILLRVTGLPVKSECSASLIAPNLALTARHCVAPLVQGRFSCTNAGELVEVDSGAGGFEPEFPPENLAFFAGPQDPSLVARGRAIVSTRPVHICMNDIALIVLDRDVDAPVIPLRRTPAAAGDVVTVVGYGAGSQQERPETLEARRRKPGAVIDRVGPDSIFDGVGSVGPRMFAIAGALACRGDSGGPALSEEDGGILGVYSTQRGDDCEAAEAENFFVHVPPYASLLDRAFAEADATPVFSDASEPEPPPEPEPEPPSSEPEPPNEPEPPSEPEPGPGDGGAPAMTPSNEPAVNADQRGGGCAVPSGHRRGAPATLALLLALVSVARRAGRARAT